MDTRHSTSEASSAPQVSSRQKILGFLAQRLKQREKEMIESAAGSSPALTSDRAADDRELSPCSEESECSDPDMTETETGNENLPEHLPGALSGHSDATLANSLEKKSAGALGGWLTRLTGAYSVAVRGLGGSLLVRGDRMNDFAETRDRLERTAAELHGPGRAAGLRRWITIMQSLSTPPHQALYTSSATSSEGDWQTLTQVASSTQAGSEAQLAMQANQMWFVDPSGGEPLTFREVFLKSDALEYIVAGFARWPLSHPAEAAVLLELFSVTLGGSKELHAGLVECITSLTTAAAKWRDAGASPEECLSLAQPIGKAIGILKQEATVAILDRQMAALRAEISEQAALAAQTFKFNQGSMQPTGDTSPGRLASGLAATAQIMAQAERLSQLAAERQELVEAGVPGVPSSDMSGTMLGMQDRHAALSDAIVDADAHISDVLRQKEESQASRARKVEEMEGRLRVVGDSIAELDASRDSLLAQLAQVEALLTQAHAERADLEESRSVYEEGIAFSLDALQHQVDELSAAQRRHNAESATLEEGRALLTAVSAQAPQVAAKQAGAAQVAAEEAKQELVHSACRHLYFQRAELQLLLRRLLFCAAELSSLCRKEESATRMGMSAISSDMGKQRRALLSSFLDAEASAAMRLGEVDAVRSAVEAACNARLPSPLQEPDAADATGPEASAIRKGAQSLEEFVDLLHSIAELGRQISGMQRPAGLPLPGQALPQETLQEPERGGEADAVSVEPPKLSSPASESCGDMCGDMLNDLSESAAQHDPKQPAGSELAEASGAASSLQTLKLTSEEAGAGAINHAAPSQGVAAQTRTPEHPLSDSVCHKGSESEP